MGAVKVRAPPGPQSPAKHSADRRAWTTVSGLRPGPAAQGRLPSAMSWSWACPTPSRSQGHRQQQPGAGNGALAVEGNLDLVQHDMPGRIEKVSPAQGS